MDLRNRQSLYRRLRSTVLHKMLHNRSLRPSRSIDFSTIFVFNRSLDNVPLQVAFQSVYMQPELQRVNRNWGFEFLWTIAPECLIQIAVMAQRFSVIGLDKMPAQIFR